MINPKVRAVYQKFPSNDVTIYAAVDLSGYENDVKLVGERKLEIFRTDTNELISSEILGKDKYRTSITVQTDRYPASPYLNNLPIKAVLSINGVIVAEDAVQFVSVLALMLLDNMLPTTKRDDGLDTYYRATDNLPYPLYAEKGMNNFDRYFINSRRGTSSPISHKIQYIDKLADDVNFVEYKRFNENVAFFNAIWIDKQTNQMFETTGGAYTISSQELAAFYNPGGIYIGPAGHDPLANEDAAPDLSLIIGIQPPAIITENNTSFTIKRLVDRFEHYAKNLNEIKHNPAVRKETRFFHVDLENLQDALTNGASFPGLYLQTPEIDKNGAYDNMSEQFAFTFVVVMPLKNGNKGQLIDTCKKITDKIINRLMLDVTREIIPGVIAGTNEGIFGPVGDGLYGWGVSIAIADAYNAEVNTADWEDLS